MSISLLLLYEFMQIIMVRKRRKKKEEQEFTNEKETVGERWGGYTRERE